MKKQSRIVWKPYTVNVSDVKPTPENFKIKTDLGKERFRQSLKTFGTARAISCNWNGKFGNLKDIVLVDGNSLIEESKAMGDKTVTAMLPERILTSKEFVDMCKIFDLAKAGEIDMDRIEKHKGTTKDFYTKYHYEPPMELLARMGSGANAKDGPKLKQGKEVEPLIEIDERQVSLFYTVKQEKEFRRMEEMLKVKFKSISTSDTIFKALKKLIV